MPPGNAVPPVAVSTQEFLLAALRRMLEETTVQVMRQAARLWGWTLKGTAKSDLVEQMMVYLGDAARMSAAIGTLSEEEVAVLSWLAATGIQGLTRKHFQAAMLEGSGMRLSQKAIEAHMQSLTERCLIFYSEYSGHQFPDLYRLWLPPLAAPKLQYTAIDQLQLPLPLTVADITQYAQHLLSMLLAEQPPATVTKIQRPRYVSGKAEPIDPRRPSLIAVNILSRWGYETPAEQQMARFLLEQMANAQLFRVNMQEGRAIPSDVAEPEQAWEAASAAERLQLLRRAYLTLPESAAIRFNSWSEWDMMFGQDRDESLQPEGFWSITDVVLQQTHALGVWFSHLVAGLQVDTWYGIEQFCQLIYKTKPDLTMASSGMSRYTWLVDGKSRYVDQLPFDRWMKTYGRIVEAWLTGPANWLLLVQIGVAGNRPAAFRRLARPPAGTALPAPPGSLRFMADGAVALTNDWRVGGLRRLLRSISVEVARDAKTTLLRLDAGAFRNTLWSGMDAAAVGDTFAAAGFPLPPEVQETLQTWQGRAGRYQLYEQMTVVEFGEDVLPEELRAISRLTSAEFYQAAPHCLIFPDPQAAPALVEELRRRGYTPQVLP